MGEIFQVPSKPPPLHRGKFTALQAIVTNLIAAMAPKGVYADSCSVYNSVCVCSIVNAAACPGVCVQFLDALTAFSCDVDFACLIVVP